MRRKFWLVGLLVLLLGAGAFWDGLYSPAEQLVGTTVMGALVVAAGGAALIGVAELGLLGLLFAGVLASLWAPASAGSSAHGPIIVAGWLMAFWLGRRFAADGWVERALCAIWAVLGPLMVFGGLAAMSYLPAHHSGRLASFLGYPIALGVLGLLGLTGALPLLEQGRRWAPLLAWGNGVAVLLSGSRGVWAVGLVLAACLLWARRDLLRPLWWPLAAALATALWTGPAVAARAPAGALLPFLIIGLTVQAVAWFPKRWLLAAATVAWAAAAALAPGWGWLLGRASALSLAEGSSVERMTFLADGLRLASHLPLGAGYRAWTALHLQGASYSYYSAEVHSAPLDLTLAFGWAAGLAFLALLARFGLGLLRQGRTWPAWRLACLAGLGALGLHALLDWDLSYGLFALPFWLGLGLLGPGAGRRTLPLPRGAAAALAGLAVAGAILVGAGDVAAELAGRALAAGNPNLALRHANLAVAVTPWNDLAQAHRGRALDALNRPAEALAALEQARRLGPYEPWYAELQAQALTRAGRVEEAAAAYREYVRLWPWYVPAYETALAAHLDMEFRASLLGDTATAEKVAASGRAILDQLAAQKAKEPAGRPRRPMDLSSPTIQQAREMFEG